MNERLVEFVSERGETVIVATQAPPTGPTMRGMGTSAVVERATQTLEEAVNRVQPATRAVLDAFRAGAQMPDELMLEFGLELSAEIGAIVTATSMQANFRVTMTWRRDAS